MSIGHDLLHGVFHFEGKIWRTLPMLAWQPGALTRRYIHGERARFVSPLAAFLFSVFLMFGVLSSLPGWKFDDANFLNPGVAGGMAQARTKLAEEKAHAQSELVLLERDLATARAKAEPNPKRIAKLQKKVAVARKARDDLARAEKTLPTSAKFTMDSESPTATENWLETRFRHAKENPALLLYKLKSSAYKYSWALIPISLPFIWLLFPLRRDVGMYDHAIFATYSLTFMSLLVVLLAVLAALGVPEWMCWTAAGLVPPLHLYKQLKGAYGLSRWGGCGGWRGCCCSAASRSACSRWLCSGWGWTAERLAAGKLSARAPTDTVLERHGPLFGRRDRRISAEKFVRIHPGALRRTGARRQARPSRAAFSA